MQITDKAWQDQFFWIIFSASISILPLMLGLIERRLIVGATIAGILVLCLRLVMRSRCRQSALNALTEPASIMLGGFVLVVIGHAIFASGHMTDQVRALVRPIAVCGASMFLVYAWMERELFAPELLRRFVFAGTLITLLCISAAVLLNIAASRGWLAINTQLAGFDVHELNDALQIVMLYMFSSAAWVASKGRRHAYIIGTLIVLLILSATMFGVIERNGGASFHPVANETVMLTVPIALTAYTLAIRFPRLTIDMVYGSICAILLAAPWLFQIVFTIVSKTESYWWASIRARTEIWDLVARRVTDSPLFGHGIDSIRYAGHVSEPLLYKTSNGLLHAHNMILQLWLDLGLFGVLPIFGLIVCAWFASHRCATEYLPVVLGGTVAIFMFALVTVSLWQTAAIAVVVSAITTIALIQPLARSGRAHKSIC